MKNLALVLSLTALTLFGFSCAKKDNNNVVTYQLNQMGQCVDSQNGTIVNQSLCTNGMYQYVNGNCIQTSTGQPVQPQLCQQMGGMYQYVNGVCIQTSTGQQVQPQLCQQMGGGMYQYINGMCIQTSTGQQVATYLCQQNGGGMNSCVGQYYVYQYGQYIPVTCTTTPYGSNTCSGQQLISISTGQQVYCQ